MHLHGGPAPVRRFLPDLIDLIWNRRIDPGKVFDLELPLDQAADGYQAMDSAGRRSRSSSAPDRRRSHDHRSQTMTTTDENGNFAGKVAFVTGAASGIGRATALAFARRGRQRRGRRHRPSRATRRPPG